MSPDFWPRRRRARAKALKTLTQQAATATATTTTAGGAGAVMGSGARLFLEAAAPYSAGNGLALFAEEWVRGEGGGFEQAARGEGVSCTCANKAGCVHRGLQLPLLAGAGQGEHDAGLLASCKNLSILWRSLVAPAIFAKASMPAGCILAFERYQQLRNAAPNYTAAPAAQLRMTTYLWWMKEKKTNVGRGSSCSTNQGKGHTPLVDACAPDELGPSKVLPFSCAAISCCCCIFAKDPPAGLMPADGNTQQQSANLQSALHAPAMHYFAFMIRLATKSQVMDGK
eukprot:scaffold5546_cov15-Tisochrysis_lutea.AAC.2